MRPAESTPRLLAAPPPNMGPSLSGRRPSTGEVIRCGGGGSRCRVHTRGLGNSAPCRDSRAWGFQLGREEFQQLSPPGGVRPQASVEWRQLQALQSCPRLLLLGTCPRTFCLQRDKQCPERRSVPPGLGSASDHGSRWSGRRRCGSFRLPLCFCCCRECGRDLPVSMTLPHPGVRSQLDVSDLSASRSLHAAGL